MSGRTLVGGSDSPGPSGPSDSSDGSRGSDGWRGGVTSDLAECVLAPNPSPWTLDGTNTWILGAGGGDCVIVDPGPLAGGHREAILDAVERRRARVSAVLLTHGHIDHSEGSAALAEYLGVPARAWDPALSKSSSASSGAALRDGEQIDVEGATVVVMATPGHSSDSVCFVLGDAILTGDTVLGTGTSMVAHPDGTLADYLRSLQHLATTCSDGGIRQLLPGHGPVLSNPSRVVEYYLSHRYERLDQVRRAVAGGALTAREVVDVVYSDIPSAVIPAAEATVLAQLEYLRDHPTD